MQTSGDLNYPTEAGAAEGRSDVGMRARVSGDRAGGLYSHKAAGHGLRRAPH